MGSKSSRTLACGLAALMAGHSQAQTAAPEPAAPVQAAHAPAAQDAAAADQAGADIVATARRRAESVAACVVRADA